MPEGGTMTTDEELAQMARAEELAGEPMGNPARWHEADLYRCQGGHVMGVYMTSPNGPLCPVCRSPTFLTFPEDRDGPLEEARLTGWKYAEGP